MTSSTQEESRVSPTSAGRFSMNDNPPAFPIDAHVATEGPYADLYMGMTLRDWFAGQALAGLSSAVLALPDATTRDVSGDAYKLADAMLAERKREQSA